MRKMLTVLALLGVLFMSSPADAQEPPHDSPPQLCVLEPNHPLCEPLGKIYYYDQHHLDGTACDGPSWSFWNVELMADWLWHGGVIGGDWSYTYTGMGSCALLLPHNMPPAIERPCPTCSMP